MMTTSMTHPAQTGMFEFWMARISGICTRYRPPAPMISSVRP